MLANYQQFIFGKSELFTEEIVSELLKKGKILHTYDIYRMNKFVFHMSQNGENANIDDHNFLLSIRRMVKSYVERVPYNQEIVTMSQIQKFVQNYYDSKL